MSPPFGYSKIFNNPLDLHLAFLRDVTADVIFIIDLYVQANNRFPYSFAEIQCGPAYYAYKFNELGINSIAVDSSNRIINFAKSLDPKESKNITWLKQRPTNLAIQNVDICLLPLDSFTYFQNDEEQFQFFDNVYNCLSEGGILIVEMNHPKDIGYIDYSQIYALSQKLYPDYLLKVEWGINNPEFDIVTGIAKTLIRITKKAKGIKTTRIISSLERTNFPNAVKLVAEKCSLKVINILGGYHYSPLTWRSNLQLLVFQKKEGFYA